VLKNNAGTTTKHVILMHDVFDNLVEKWVDATGDGFYEQKEIRVNNGGHVVAVLGENGSVQRRFLHGPATDRVLAEEDAQGIVLWPATDNQGTTRDLIRSDGTVASHLTYSSFGQITAATGTLPFFAYTGREWDADIGLQYNRAPWYDPVVGRWLNEDPVGFAAGDQHLARYVGNNPVNYTDPNGLEELSAADAALLAEARRVRVERAANTFDPNADLDRPGLRSGHRLGNNETGLEAARSGVEAANVVVDMTPVGDAKGVVEAFAGEDATGRNLGGFWARVLHGGCSLLGPFGDAFGKGWRWVKRFMPWADEAAGAAARYLPNSVPVPEGYTRVYRAVSEAEYQDILATGRLRTELARRQVVRRLP
jgi:RHS repeat-associated protein